MGDLSDLSRTRAWIKYRRVTAGAQARKLVLHAGSSLFITRNLLYTSPLFFVALTRNPIFSLAGVETLLKSSAVTKMKLPPVLMKWAPTAIGTVAGASLVDISIHLLA